MIKLDFETDEETIILLNSIMVQLKKCDNNGLTDEQKALIEQFRLKMILPIVTDAKHPLLEAFIQYFGSEQYERCK